MSFCPFWEGRVQDQWALDVVRRGYSLEFLSLPPLTTSIKWTHLQSHPDELLQTEIQEMLMKGAVEQVSPHTPGFYCTFFLVPKKDGGWRPVLNLKPLNKFLSYQRFRMETPRSILSVLSRGEWLASLDLRDAYFHVPILPAHRPFLRFAFGKKVYQFRVLPFGLSTAPRVFTKMLAPIVGLIHQEGIRFFPYLDDCLLVAPSSHALQSQVSKAVSILQQAGFLVNWKKSLPVPSQDLQFIGMRIRPDLGMVFLPEDRAFDLVQCAKLFRQGSWLPIRLFLRLLGLMAACLTVIRLARLRMRPIQLYLLSQWNRRAQPDLDRKIQVPQSLCPYLLFWQEKDNLIQGVSLSPPVPQVVLTTDASLTAWGGHLDGYKVQGLWSTSQQNLHINRLEMLAVLNACRTFLSRIQGKVVLLRTDNVSVVQYVNNLGGTKSAALCALVTKLLDWCQQHNIQMLAEHLPGVSNVLADSLSRRIMAQTEWSLKQSVANQLFHRLGEPQIDLFATAENKKLPVFCSWRPDSQAYHVDAMTMSWVGLQAYAFPPVALIPRVVEKASREVQTLILVAPRWSNRSWYPRLLELLVAPPIRLPLLPDLLTQQRGRLLHANPGLLSLVAWPLSGDRSRQQAFRQELRRRYWRPGQLPPTPPMNVVGSIFDDGVSAEISIPLQLL